MSAASRSPVAGLSVRFDHTVDQVTGKPECIHISNEDDWMWGVRRTKAAAWSLEDSTVPPGAAPLHAVAELI